LASAGSAPKQLFAQSSTTTDNIDRNK